MKFDPLMSISDSFVPTATKDSGPGFVFSSRYDGFPLEMWPFLTELMG